MTTAWTELGTGRRKQQTLDYFEVYQSYDLTDWRWDVRESRIYSKVSEQLEVGSCHSLMKRENSILGRKPEALLWTY